MNSKLPILGGSIGAAHRRRSAIFGPIAVLGLVAGCASGNGRELVTRDGGTRDASVAVAPCPQLNLTAPCTCGSAHGRRTCETSGWTSCQCAADPTTLPDGSVGSTQVPAGNLRSDITFDWERTGTNIGASCEPGHYEGDFQGLYASQLTFVCAPIPVFALGTPLQPGLSFTLEQSASGEYLEIRDGVMVGTADGLFPFRGTITGTLNCQTLKFEATLEGYYSLGVDGIGMFRFVGPLLADYDPVTHSMINATWDVAEYDFATGTPRPDICGGAGVWTAEWVP